MESAYLNTAHTVVRDYFRRRDTYLDVSGCEDLDFCRHGGKKSRTTVSGRALELWAFVPLIVIIASLSRRGETTRQRSHLKHSSVGRGAENNRNKHYETLRYVTGSRK
jgi:hypothetical protein